MRTQEEEVVNAYSHLVSSVLSILFCAIFLNRVAEQIHQLQIFLLGAASFWTLFFSFLYHNTHEPKLRQRNLVLDRVGIYILISASGLSFSLGIEEDYAKVLYSGIILSVMCFLISRYCCKREESELFSISSCLLFSVLSIFPLMGIFNESLLVNPETISSLIFSMVCYCAGVVFYTVDSKKWAHTAWHFLAMAGYAGSFIAHLIAAGAI